jgi:aspartate/methionine/tyrosine aminotransferase
LLLPHCICHTPAGMYVWAKLPEGVQLDDLQFCQQLVAETGVALAPGRGFGPGGVGFVRFALVQPVERLTAAAEAVGAFADRLRARSA